MDNTNWIAPTQPKRCAIPGRYVTLVPIDRVAHGQALFEMSQEHGASERFRYLFDEPPSSREEFDLWLTKSAVSDDPMFFAVLDNHTGRAEGRQALMRIDLTHGVIEIGNIFWGQALARTRAATEALYLTARHVFDDLHFRRLEWKCDSLNEPSKAAALRFGFQAEGTFRNHMRVKGKNRDTSWFSITDSEWAAIKPTYETWLQPCNFDDSGQQKIKLNAVLGPR